MPGSSLSEGAQRFARLETAAALSGLLGSAACFWLPARPLLIARADLKVEQLHLARRLGFATPATLVTNSPEEFLDFYNRHNGQVISKGVNGAGFVHCFPGLARYTERVSPAALTGYRAIRMSPVIFQTYVDKQVELRVTVVGRRLFAAEIDSQRSRHSRVDWRHYDLATTPYRQHQLPATVEGCCLALLKALELSYAAIDLILTPDGRYVFLEINPNGQFTWIEELVGFPISAAVGELLLTGGYTGTD